MYESPLNAITKRMVKDISQRFDDMVLQEVINVGVHVDREELIKALEYDRDQYRKGFADGVEWSKPNWISVRDRLPETDGAVLAYTRYGEIRVFISDEDGDWFDESVRFYSRSRIGEVTHWMHLPEAPKEEE